MKKNIFKAMVATVAMLAAAPVFAENDNDKIINTDTMSEGKLVTREMSQVIDGETVFLSRSEITYVGGSNLIAEKREYTWNAEANKWDFNKVYSYAYENGSYTITLTLASGQEYTETYFR